MEMLAVLASMKRLVFQDVMGTIWKLHHNHPSKSYSFVFWLLLFPPFEVLRQKANMLTVDCVV